MNKIGVSATPRYRGRGRAAARLDSMGNRKGGKPTIATTG